MKRLHVLHLGAADETLTLTPQQSHHLVHVMRAEIGTRVVLFDGEHRQGIAELVSADGDAARVRVLTVEHIPPQPVRMTLLLGLPKNPATDLALRMATEAGVSCVLPVWAERTQGRPDRHERWNRILASAAQQCGRADLPELHAPQRLTDALSAIEPGTVLLYGARAGLPPPRKSAPDVALAIGPEGGWSPAELEELQRRGGHPVSLGPYILRTETAVAIGIARCR